MSEQKAQDFKHVDFSDIETFQRIIDPIIEKCLSVIEASGINANDAQAVPYLLERAIESCNHEMIGHTTFKVYLTEEERFLKEHPQSHPLQQSQ